MDVASGRAYPGRVGRAKPAGDEPGRSLGFPGNHGFNTPGSAEASSLYLTVSVVSSDSQNVHLDSGTQLMLRVK